MRRLVLAAGVMVLSSCGGGNQEAVGANSPDSIVTTAVGNVVGTIPNEAATPGNAQFLKAYRGEFNENPCFYSAADYQIATLMFDAVRRAGTDEPAAVIKSLEDHAYQGLTGEEQIRAADHQVSKKYLLARGKAKKAMANADDFADIVASSVALDPRNAADCRR